MQRILYELPNHVMHLAGVSILSLFILVVLTVQNIVLDAKQQGTIVWEGTCTADYLTTEGSIGMVLNCDDHQVEATVYNDDVVRSLLGNSQPLTCQVYASAATECEL